MARILRSCVVIVAVYATSVASNSKKDQKKAALSSKTYGHEQILVRPHVPQQRKLHHRVGSAVLPRTPLNYPSHQWVATPTLSVTKKGEKVNIHRDQQRHSVAQRKSPESVTITAPEMKNKKKSVDNGKIYGKTQFRNSGGGTKKETEKETGRVAGTAAESKEGKGTKKRSMKARYPANFGPPPTPMQGDPQDSKSDRSVVAVFPAIRTANEGYTFGGRDGPSGNPFLYGVHGFSPNDSPNPPQQVIPATYPTATTAYNVQPGGFYRDGGGFFPARNVYTAAGHPRSGSRYAFGGNAYPQHLLNPALPLPGSFYALNAQSGQQGKSILWQGYR